VIYTPSKVRTLKLEIKSGSGIGVLGKLQNPLQASIDRKERKNKVEYQRLVGKDGHERNA
jgi:hypothetical protein